MAVNIKSVRVTVYLPDELRERAKAKNLNLSRLLRDAVERELSGEGATPGVELERVGGSIEVRVKVSAAELRKKLRG
jgi:hypothetical protein